jgi:hypothetical protein
LLCAHDGIAGVQLIIHDGATVLLVEEPLIKDFHEVMNWFFLNVVRLEA